mmetsp:Transcript_87577/g.256060  ORF Transcript_87577/g.256060 Transcript_87577/m.256060 type:complete len:417 (+) Transcript_87577:17-1267(+)
MASGARSCVQKNDGRTSAHAITRRWQLPSAAVRALCTCTRARARTPVARSVVEQPEVGEGHGHAVGVTGGDDLLVGHGAARLGHVGDANPGTGVDGVAEGEEGVRGDGDAVEPFQELGLVLRGQRRRHLLEVLLPLLELRLLHVAFDVADPRVHPVLPLDSLLEGQGHDLRVEAGPPGGGLPCGKLHAVHAALLPRTHADHHAALGVAHGVGLRVLDRDGREDEVQLGLLRQVLILRDDLLQPRVVKQLVVALLHEAHSAHHSVLLCRRHERGVGLEHDELALLLRLQDLQGLWLETWCDDAIADLNLQDLGRCDIHLVRDGDKVAEGAHRVGVPGPHVGGGHRRELLVLDLVHHALLVRERHAESCARRAHVLEGCGGGHARGHGQLVGQLPRVHRVQEVDVAGRAGLHVEGQLA